MKRYKIEKGILNIAFDETVTDALLRIYFTDEAINHMVMTGYLVEIDCVGMMEGKKKSKKKKGIKYWLCKLPHKVEFEFNSRGYLYIYKCDIGYRIQFYGSDLGCIDISNNKSLKKALKSAYKVLKKDGYINE